MPPAPHRRPLSGAAIVAVSLGVLGAVHCAKRSSEPKPAATQPSGNADAAALPANWLVTERDVRASEDLKRLQAKFDSDTDDHARQFALTAAARIGEPAAVIWLAQIAAKDRRFGRWAEDVLAEVANRDAGLELGDVATSKGPPRVRSAAIRALAASGDLPQAAQLGALCADPQQPLLVRESSASTLGLMKRPGAIPALASALASARADTRPTGQQLRVIIIQALERIDTPEARAIIAAHAQGNLSPLERAVVTNALEPSPAQTSSEEAGPEKTGPARSHRDKH